MTKFHKIFAHELKHSRIFLSLDWIKKLNDSTYMWMDNEKSRRLVWVTIVLISLNHLFITSNLKKTWPIFRRPRFKKTRLQIYQGRKDSFNSIMKGAKVMHKFAVMNFERD